MINFKINNCLLISLLLITISNAFQIVSDNTYINYAGGYVKVKFYYDSEEKLMGYKYTNPINMEVLYDYKNHVTYKRGNYVGNSDYYVDYFDFNTTNKAANMNNNSSNSGDFYKFEKIYYYDDFPIIDSIQYRDKKKSKQVTTKDLRTSYIRRPYTDELYYLLEYEGFIGSNIEYMYYTLNDDLLEFKLENRDLTFVLGKVEKTKIDIRKEFGVYSDDFSNTITKSNSEIDIIFLLDESENIAEEEFNKMIDFCKINVMQYSLELNKTRFAIVGYGSYGVLHLDFTNSIYDIITTLDKLKTQQIRGKSCLGCGLSIASGVFDNGDRGVQQMLINVMASKVNYPTYNGECIKKNQTTYYDYCIDSCNKLEYEQCSDQYDHDVIIKNKVIKGKRSAIQCKSKNYNENGYKCSDCSCSEDKKYVLCKECKLKKEYAYKRCRNTKQALGCDSDNIITYYENYTDAKKNILPTGSNRIIVNIGIGEETYKQVNELSTRMRGNLKFETDYKFSSFDQFKDVSSITNFTSHISKHLYDNTGNECGKHCKGVCGLNGQCYCPTACYRDTEDQKNYVVCITDDKNITVSGCQKAPITCSPPLTEDGIPNMCYTTKYNEKEDKCEYHLRNDIKNKKTSNPCKVNICDPRDGTIKEVINPAYCYVPENRSNVEMIVDGHNRITVDITYKLIKPCEKLNNECVMAVYDTECTSNSKYYNCYGIDGKCKCVLDQKNIKECQDVKDDKNQIYKQAIINDNKCDYIEYKLESEDQCESTYSKISNTSETITVEKSTNLCQAPKPTTGSVNAVGNGGSSVSVHVLYTYEITKNCSILTMSPGCEAASYITKCESLRPRYKCEMNGDQCECRVKDDTTMYNDCSYYPYLDGQINYCYMLQTVDSNGNCRYRQRYSTSYPDGYHICQENDENHYILSDDSKKIASINSSNTIDIGTIPDYTFGGQVFDAILDDGTTIVKVYTGYARVGKIVYNESNQPELTLNKFNVSLPDNKDIACSDSECIENDNIPTNAKQYEFYTMEYDTKKYSFDYLEPSNKYYNVMSGISISQIHPINHPFGDHQDCISEDKCYIGFETYDGKCLQSQLILPETNDIECFEYVCDDGKLIQKPLNNQFTRINSPCVKKYGDVLKIFNGKMWYYHLTKYVNRLFDILFIVSIVIVIAISFVVGIVINFIRIKKIKSYVQLDNNENIELEDVDNMAK